MLDSLPAALPSTHVFFFLTVVVSVVQPASVLTLPFFFVHISRFTGDYNAFYRVSKRVSCTEALPTFFSFPFPSLCSCLGQHLFFLFSILGGYHAQLGCVVSIVYCTTVFFFISRWCRSPPPATKEKKGLAIKNKNYFSATKTRN